MLNTTFDKLVMTLVGGAIAAYFMYETIGNLYLRMEILLSTITM